jgi:hypothetical protein
MICHTNRKKDIKGYITVPCNFITQCNKQTQREEEVSMHITLYRGAENSLALPTSRCILFDGENIFFDASLVIYINSTNIPPIMIINRIHEYQNLLSL